MALLERDGDYTAVWIRKTLRRHSVSEDLLLQSQKEVALVLVLALAGQVGVSPPERTVPLPLRPSLGKLYSSAELRCSSY
ncbi:MAG: hypothetical protein ACRD7E_27385 [Bryobacteraceae bacterium]